MLLFKIAWLKCFRVLNGELLWKWKNLLWVHILEMFKRRRINHLIARKVLARSSCKHYSTLTCHTWLFLSKWIGCWVRTNGCMEIDIVIVTRVKRILIRVHFIIQLLLLMLRLLLKLLLLPIYFPFWLWLFNILFVLNLLT